MKVLSLKEPWASLVKQNIKNIETRSWNTKYRGEIYIHASKSKVNLRRTRIKKLSKMINNDFNYGCIIAKCQLVNCIYMDESFIDLIKNNDIEYLCGEYKVGRYAWILEGIEPLDKPIHINGHLGLWDYKK